MPFTAMALAVNQADTWAEKEENKDNVFRSTYYDPIIQDASAALGLVRNRIPDSWRHSATSSGLHKRILGYTTCHGNNRTSESSC